MSAVANLIWHVGTTLKGVAMFAPRLLLPFTHGIDAQAIECVMRVAHYEGATLVLLSLIAVQGEKKGPRLEHIEQSKDILKYVRTVARWHHVQVELHEVYTNDPVIGIISAYQQLSCDRILLAVREQKAVLLQTAELRQLLRQYGTRVEIDLIQLPPKTKPWHYLSSFANPVRHTQTPLPAMNQIQKVTKMTQNIKEAEVSRR
jgi:hypothetical protein